MAHQWAGSPWFSALAAPQKPPGGFIHVVGEPGRPPSRSESESLGLGCGIVALRPGREPVPPAPHARGTSWQFSKSCVGAWPHRSRRGRPRGPAGRCRQSSMSHDFEVARSPVAWAVAGGRPGSLLPPASLFLIGGISLPAVLMDDTQGARLGLWLTHCPPCWSCTCGPYVVLAPPGSDRWVHSTVGKGSNPDPGSRTAPPPPANP